MINRLKSKYIIIIAVICIFWGIILQNQIPHHNYKNVYWLPIVFGFFLVFLSITFYRLKDYSVFWLIFIQQIIRYLIIPTKIAYNDFQLGENSQYVDIAIYIYILELMVISFVFYIIPRKSKFISTQKGKKLLSINNTSVVILLVLILSLFINSNFFTKLNFVWEIDKFIELRLQDNIENISPIISVFFPIIRAYIVIFSISIVDSLKIKESLKVIISFILILFNATLIIGVSRFSIIYTTLPLIFILTQKFSNFRKRILFSSGIGLIVIIAIASIIRFADINDNDGLSGFFSLTSLNAYFGGIINYSVGLDSYFNNNVNFFDMHKYFFSDLLQNIPGLSSFTNDEYKSLIKFNKEIYGFSGTRDQIIPISISGIYHWSFFFFIYTFLIYLLAFKFEIEANKHQRSILAYFYFSMALTCGLYSMINFGSFSSNLILTVVIFIPLFNLLYKTRLLK